MTNEFDAVVNAWSDPEAAQEMIRRIRDWAHAERENPLIREYFEQLMEAARGADPHVHVIAAPPDARTACVLLQLLAFQMAACGFRLEAVDVDHVHATINALDAFQPVPGWLSARTRLNALTIAIRASRERTAALIAHQAMATA